MIILAGSEGHDSAGRLVNGLQTAAEVVEHDDEVEFFFDGGGTAWIPELEDPDSDHHDLYQAVRALTSLSDFCSGAFGVSDAVDASGLVRLEDHGGHPSKRSLVADGYEVLAFYASVGRFGCPTPSQTGRPLAGRAQQ